MAKQFIFGLVPSDRMYSDVAECLRQPTGETAIVNDDDGNPIEVPVYWGGFASVGDAIDDWVFALLFSTDAGIAALRALDGAPVLEVAALTENWTELEEPLSVAQFVAISNWLAAQNLTPLDADTTQHDAVDIIGDYFQSGFDEMNYMPG